MSSAHASPQPSIDQRNDHTIKVFRHDPKRPTMPGKNPVQIDVITIAHQLTAPRRERAAIEAVARKFQSTPSIGHMPSGDMTAIISAPDSMQSTEPQDAAPALSEAAIREILRSPILRRELTQLASDPRVRGGR